MTIVDPAAHAVRHATALLDATHVAVIEVRGPGAFDALDRLLPCDLFLYDGQARQTLLLDDEGSVLADVSVAKIDGAFLLYVDGLAAAETISLVRESASSGASIEVQDLLEEHALLSLHGPFAWELAAAWLGRAVLGLPPLALFRTESGTILRAGKTGEYGYETLVPRSVLASARERLSAVGERFDLVVAPLDVIDRCVLENGGYVARNERCAGLTPSELQLQWRTSSRKSYRGRAGVDRRRASTCRRVAWFGSEVQIPGGASLTLDDEPAGEVLACVAAPARAGAIGLALLDRRLSHPGLSFTSGPAHDRRAADAAIELRTISPPLIEPLSTRVRTLIDSYATRDPLRFPRHETR